MRHKPNPDKKLSIKLDGETYYRYPIKTETITPDDDIKKVVVSKLKGLVAKNDIIGISEKATAISQGRAYPKDSIKVSPLARFLVRFVTKSKRGVGISSPETFQLAIEECGPIRIILAASIGGFCKLIGLKGIFYYIAGNKARLIDGAAEYVIPPYNSYVSKGPKKPNQLSEKISQKIEAKVAIIDINDYGGQVVGVSKKVSSKERKKISQILKDNPLGQTDESTPIVIISKNKKTK